MRVRITEDLRVVQLQVAAISWLKPVHRKLSHADRVRSTHTTHASLHQQLCNSRGKIRREDADAKVCIPVTVSSGSNAMVLALNAIEIRSAEMFWVSAAQREVYAEVIDMYYNQHEKCHNLHLYRSLVPNWISPRVHQFCELVEGCGLLTTLQELALQ